MKFNLKDRKQKNAEKQKNKKKPSRKNIIICVLIIIFIILAMDNRIQVTHYESGSEKIGDDIKIALIADLHCTNYGKNQNKLVKLIKEGEPDLILLAGDIFHHFGTREKGHELISQAAKIAPVYYIAGNHDKANPYYDEILEEVVFYGGIVLDDDLVEVEVNANKILLAGGEDSEVMKMKLNRDFKGNDGFRLMLNHYPEEYIRFTDDFDMMMAGHLHGGQVRIPFIMPNGLYAPRQGFFPKYTGSMYEITDNFTLVVSRGISKRRSGRFRIFNRPELVFVDIVS
ncbi:MAG: metallophosphoesterase [Oscillospiraceae bacterium]|nr:metallophosphoesterase [Oscillospiraceae bacterium]